MTSNNRRAPLRGTGRPNELFEMELSRPEGNAATVKELREIVKHFASTVLCVLKTQIHKARVEGLKTTLGCDNAFAVSSLGRSSGLAIYWNNNIRV